MTYSIAVQARDGKMEGQLYELGKDFNGYFARVYERRGNIYTPVKRRIGPRQFQRLAQADPRTPVYQDHGVAGFTYVYEPNGTPDELPADLSYADASGGY